MSAQFIKKNWLNEYFINNINNENKLLDSRFSRMIKIKNNVDALWNNKKVCYVGSYYVKNKKYTDIINKVYDYFISSNIKIPKKEREKIF